MRQNNGSLSIFLQFSSDWANSIFKRFSVYSLYFTVLIVSHIRFRLTNENKRSFQNFMPGTSLVACLIRTLDLHCSSIIVRTENLSHFFSFRVCETSEDEFETIVSKSSDVFLSFENTEHTWAFSEELIHNNDEDYIKFTINFVTLQEVPVKIVNTRLTCLHRHLINNGMPYKCYILWVTYFKINIQNKFIIN